MYGYKKKTAGIIRLQAEFMKDEWGEFVLFWHSEMCLTLTSYKKENISVYFGST